MSKPISKPISNQGNLPRRPLLHVVGLLMAAVVALGVTGMLSSMVIAQINGGMAAAVNQSGTLRMQSYRIGVVLADATLSDDEHRQRVARLAAEFEQRLKSPRLADAVPQAIDDPVRLAYERVRWRWSHEMRHALTAFSSSTDSASVAEGGRVLAGRGAYLGSVDDFVEDIHQLVRVLEERAERHIETLRLIQAVVLVLTVVVVLVTMIVMQRRVLTPLGELLDCADRARRGDFSGRTRFDGGDEPGRLGAAMNLMTDGLSRIYGELEERVAAKTRDLARTNHSLELLYRTSRTLNEPSASEQVLRRVLEDIRGQLHLAAVTLCLTDRANDVIGDSLADCGRGSGNDCIGTGLDQDASADRAADDCAPCRDAVVMVSGADVAATARGWGRESEQRQSIGFPVGNAQRDFGTLRIVLDPGCQLEPWQRPLLESLAGHLATALSLQLRMREGRRLVLHEERSILARELHDSLAQSLAYLKIQAARLDAVLRAPSQRRASAATAADILAEIRTGISSANRQLRELLTTFRIKMDGLGLGSALVGTVQEFRDRSDLDIALDDHLPRDLLSPNEEVHVLQIVREALSNVVRHARARHCRVALYLAGAGVCVDIGDDGEGLPAGDADHGHYGMAIMRERAGSLDGMISIESGADAGTKLRLRFVPRQIVDPPADPGTTDLPSLDLAIEDPVFGAEQS